MAQRRHRPQRDRRHCGQAASITIPLFPLHPGSKGACSALAARARVVGERFPTIKAFLESHGRDPGGDESGIGARMGDGMLVLDFDPRDGGFESRERLETEFASLPQTAVALTGEYEGVRGEHFFYRYDSNSIHVPSRPLTRILGSRYRGIDVKADGGFVVMPPSLHASGVRYEFARPLSEVVAAPTWLLTLLASEPPSEVALGPDGLRLRSGAVPSREVEEWVFGPEGIPSPQWEKIARCAASLWADTREMRTVGEVGSLIYGALVRSPDYDPTDPWIEAEVIRDVRRFLSKGGRG